MMTKTSERSYFFEVEPVPASRPRVTRWGTYYGKRYERFRVAMVQALQFNKSAPISGDLWLEAEFICPPPKKITRTSPRGDIDNYVKGPLDSMTKHGGFWNDDDQIVHIEATKRYQKGNEKYGIRIRYGSTDTPAV
jgi:Holliday junction resolvase RusA-like endonuclease